MYFCLDAASEGVDNAGAVVVIVTIWLKRAREHQWLTFSFFSAAAAAAAAVT